MKTKHSGFTLLELLVVVAIIGILSGLLFPAIGKMQAKGRAVACVNNLKQLHTAAVMFSEDHGGKLPASASSLKFNDNGDEWVEKGWVHWDVDDLGNHDNKEARRTYWWNEGGSTAGTESVREGTLFSYVGGVGSEASYVCPEMQRTVRKDPDHQDKVVTRSYGMNRLNQVKYFAIKGVSRKLLFADQGFKRKSYKRALEDPEDAPWSDSDGSTRRYHRQMDGCIDSVEEHIGEYHRGERGNCVFCDGHVENVHYDDTQYVLEGAWEAGARIE